MRGTTFVGMLGALLLTVSFVRAEEPTAAGMLTRAHARVVALRHGAASPVRDRRVAAEMDRLFDWSAFVRPEAPCAAHVREHLVATTFAEHQDVMAIQAERATADGDTWVDASFSSGSARPAGVTFVMRQRAGEWTVVDIRIDGHSLAEHYAASCH
jgi:hypothetical protein